VNLVGLCDADVESDYSETIETVKRLENCIKDGFISCSEANTTTTSSSTSSTTTITTTISTSSTTTTI